MVKRIFLKVVVVTTIALPLLTHQGKLTNAHTIEPFVKDYLLEINSTTEDAFLFTNTSEKDQFFLLSTGAYNPENEEFTDGEILAKTKDVRIEVAAGEQVEIPYTIDVPRALDTGSYFNVIIVEEDTLQGDSDENINLQSGFGIIIAMHIVEEGGTIKGAFTRLSETAISVINNGFPYLAQTEIEYKYLNNSQYVFAPIAELRIYDMTTNERVLKESINKDMKKVYPGKEISESFTVDLWTYKNFTHDFRVVARTYNQFDSTYMEEEVIVTAPPILLYSGSGLGLLAIAVIFLRKSKKKK